MTDVAAQAPPVVTDPVVIYDIMIEARTRLIGRYLALHQEGRVDFVLEQTARTDAVDIDDLDAQLELTDRFKSEYQALRSA